MKKNIAQIVLFAGFMFLMLGALFDPIIFESRLPAAWTAITARTIIAVLVVAFVNSKNKTLQNVGWGLCGIVGIEGVVMLTLSGDFMISHLGMLLMLIASIIYLVYMLVNFAGYVKSKGGLGSSDVPATLNTYKDMETDKIITSDEFEALKAKVLAGVNIEAVGDLKKWKKLLDQKIITDEEFASLKERLFK